jgi:hypothetical protein
MFKREWSKTYSEDIKILKNQIKEYSDELRKCLPTRILNKRFLKSRNDFMLDSFSKESNVYLKFSNFQEFRVLKLLECLSQAESKYAKNNTNAEQEEYSDSSPLILTNQIIKKSFDYTSLLSIINWLQQVFAKEEQERIKKIEKLAFRKTVQNIKGNQKFHPDMLNIKNDIVDEEEMENFNKIFDLIILKTRQGKIDEAQRLAEYHNQFFLGAMLNGGMPMNDCLIDRVEKFKKFDFDLLLPFMKTKELNEFIQSLNESREKSEKYYSSINHQHSISSDQIIGNPNWILWFYANYSSCDLNTNFEEGNRITLLQTYISGNPKFLQNYTKSNIYEYLYANLLSYLNLSVIEEHYKSEKTEYQHCDDPTTELSDLFTRNRKTSIHQILKSIREQESYLNIISKDYLTDIELDLIELHFTTEEVYKYELLDKLLIKLINYFQSEQFENYIKDHYKVIDEMINFKGYDLKLTKDEENKKRELNYLLIRVNYFKAIFTILIGYYSYNSHLFEKSSFQEHEEGIQEILAHEPLISLINQIRVNFDYLISQFFFVLTNFNLSPKLSTFALSFCLNMENIKSNLLTYANKLTDSVQYKELVEEIEIYFSDQNEELNTFLASETNIYEVEGLVLTIDDVLARDLRQEFKIHPDDESKINQISFLFSEGKLEKKTILKYVLKLSLKFLSNNKMNETFLLNNQIFSRELDVRSIFDSQFIEENKLYMNDRNFLNVLESLSLNNEEYSADNVGYSYLGIYFIVVLIRAVLNCYFDYLNLIKNVINNLLPSIKLKEKGEQVVQNFKEFIYIARLIIRRADLIDILTGIFEDNVYLNDIVPTVSKWIFQVFKWTVDLYRQDLFVNHPEIIFNDDR